MWREPYSLISQPFPDEPAPPDRERVRWMQDCLNQSLGLQIPVNGVMGPETRSALRSFQQQQGLQVSGIVSPKTEQALSAVCEAGQDSRAASEEMKNFWEVLPSNAELEMEYEARTVPPAQFDFEWEGFDGEIEHVQGEGLGKDPATIQPCDKFESAVLRVPFRIDFADFLKLVCCAIGRWMPFRTDRPPGRQAWCFVKKHEALLWDLHTEMFVKKIPCVELQAQYCRRRGATIDVTIKLKQFLSTACRPSSLCKTGVCNPSLACPPTTQPHPEFDPRPPRCKTMDGLTRRICDDAKRICKLADELNDPWSRDKCEKARASCQAALERSKSCGSVTDRRHVPAPTREATIPALEFDFEWETNEWEGTLEPEIATLDELVGDLEHQPTPWGPTPGTQWPRGRTFKPNAPSIPSGPYSLGQTRKCSVVADVDQLSIEIQRFEKLIQELRRRRNEPASPQLEEIRSKANRKFNDVTTLINVIIADVKNGTYRRGGCSDRDFAVATCKMRMLGGLWCKSPSLKKARCNLVFLLRNSRGKFANVWCTKLGVPLAKDWCKGHTCCCPGVG